MASDPLSAVNGTSGVIPRYAAVEPTGSADAAGRVLVRKATRADSATVLFNGPLEVPAGGAFGAYPPTPTAVAGLDPLDLPLGTDAQVGTRVGDWFLRSGQKGFRTLARQTEGAVMVMPEPQGGGGGFYARITGNAGKRYSFVQVAVRAENPPGTVTDDVIVVTGGVTGSTSAGWAYDIGGGSTDLTTPSPALIVLMTPNPLAAGTWLFGPINVCP